MEELRIHHILGNDSKGDGDQGQEGEYPSREKGQIGFSFIQSRDNLEFINCME